MAYDGTLKFDTSLDASGFQKGAGKLGEIVKGLSVFSLLEKGFAAVTSSIDAAVSRYDTLNKFPKVLQQMGFGADEAGAATQKLSDGIQGLPTTLDSVVSTAQRLTVLTGNLESATDTTLALNNAFLASGASSEGASRGLDQYVQMLSSGKVDMESWRTLQETMGYALSKTAEAFGFAGASAQNDLYAALRDGEITFTQFNSKLIELNNGVGGFAELAKTSTGGIGTAWANLKTAIVKGTTDIVSSIDKGLSQTRFKSIENVINGMKEGVSKALAVVAKAFEAVASKADVLVPAIGLVAGAFVALKVKAAIAAVIQGVAAAAQSASIAFGWLAAGESAATVASIGMTTAQKALTVAVAAGNVIKAAAVAVMGLFTGSSVVATGATLTLGGALHALGAAIYAALGPFGLILGAIVAVVAAVAGLIAIFDTSSAAYKQEKENLKSLREEHEKYAQELNDSKEAASQEAQEKVAQAQANRDVMNSLAALVDENGELTGSAEEARFAVAELNGNIEGLGLAFDESAGKINMSAQELREYGENLEAVAQYEAAQAEYNNVLSERNSLQAKINALEAKKEIYNQMVAEGAMTQDEANSLTKEANELLSDYGESMAGLEIDVKAYERAVKAAYDEEAEIGRRRQELLNNQSDEIKQLAYQYGLSFNQIADEAARMQGGLEEWSNGMAAKFTKSGMDIGMLAQKWGMSAAQVQAYCDEWGMSYDQFNERMKETHTEAGEDINALAAKWGVSVESIRTWIAMNESDVQGWADMMGGYLESVTNGFDRMEQGSAVSLQKFIENLQYNQEATANWSANMTALMAAGVDSGVIAKLREMGEEGAATAQLWVEELTKLNGGTDIALGSLNETAQARLNELATVMSSGTTTAAQAAQTDAVIQEYINTGGNYAKAVVTGYEAGSALSTAVTAQTESAKTAAEAVDFTSVGQNIADDTASSITGATGQMTTAVGGMVSGAKAEMEASVAEADFSTAGRAIADSLVEGVKGADMSGITAGIAEVVRSGSGGVSAAVATMSASVLSALRSMSSQAKAAVTQMMTAINTAIVSRAATVRSSITNVGNAVVTAMSTMRAQASALATQMMGDIYSAIVSRTATVRSAAAAMASGVVSALNAMVSGGVSAASQMMSGMLSAMDSMAPSLYAKAREIANNIASTIRAALDVRSPSRVMIDIFTMVMMGAYKGMAGMAGKLYRKAGDISKGIAHRLTITPAAARGMVGRLSALAGSPAMFAPGFIAQGGGGGAAVTYVTNLTQNITSPKPLSPSEMTREGRDLLRRSKWQLP